jgi:hypothetical protein
MEEEKKKECGWCSFKAQGETCGYCSHPKQEDEGLKIYAYWNDSCGLFTEYKRKIRKITWEIA